MSGEDGSRWLTGGSASATPRVSGSVHYLDNDRLRIEGLRIAGLGGIIGNPRRPRRRTDDEYLLLLEALLESRTDILLVHDGPDAPLPGFRGSPLVRELVEQLRPSLVVRGHAHWERALVELAGALGLKVVIEA